MATHDHLPLPHATVHVTQHILTIYYEVIVEADVVPSEINSTVNKSLTLGLVFTFALWKSKRRSKRLCWNNAEQFPCSVPVSLDLAMTLFIFLWCVRVAW